MTLIGCYTRAIGVPQGSPQYEIAAFICQSRGIDPYDWVNTPIGGMTAWQTIIFEAFMMRGLTE